MKKAQLNSRAIKKFLLFIGIILLVILVLNLKVTTSIGIDYRVYTKSMPLYLKVLDFFDRHFQYRQLIREITSGCKTDEEKALKAFAWTCKNIKRVPEGFPIIDDHIWYIIVRGYGAGDQHADVFTTLCNYAGVDAFYASVRNIQTKSKKPLSFVKINEKWTLFDPYAGVYFINSDCQLASIEEIKAGQWGLVSFKMPSKTNADYASYVAELPLVNNANLMRFSLQTPLKRLFHELKKLKVREQGGIFH